MWALCAFLGGKDFIIYHVSLAGQNHQSAFLKYRFQVPIPDLLNQIVEERALKFVSLKPLQVFLMINQV